MMDSKAYKDGIEAIDRAIEIRHEKRVEVLSEWVDKHHPLKIGDIVEVTGWSHKGKKMMVDQRKVVLWTLSFKNNWEWTATGRVIKKNGEPGVHIGEWERHVFEEDKDQE